MKAVPKIQMFKDDNNQFRWHLVARNGEIVCASDEGFVNEDDCVGNIRIVQDEMALAQIEFDYERDPRPEPEDGNDDGHVPEQDE